MNRRIARESTQQSDTEDSENPTIPKRYVIRFDRAYVEAILSKQEARGHLTLKHDRLKYHPFLVSRDPVKPPGFLAKATLAGGAAVDVDVNGTDHDNALDSQVAVVEDDPEIVNHGKDEATLQLVAKLSESPVRSLRKRPATSSEPASVDRSRPKRARRTMNQVYGHIDSPRRSGRSSAVGPIPAAGIDSQTHAHAKADVTILLNTPVEEFDNGTLEHPIAIDDGDEGVDLDADADGEVDPDADGEWEEDDPDLDLDAEGEDEYIE
jgi:hypothetical protein